MQVARIFFIYQEVTMNISPVSARLIKASSPAFAASLARKPGVNKYLDSLDFKNRKIAEDALYLFAEKLHKRSESTVLEIDTIAPEKAKDVIIGTDPEVHYYKYYNPETDSDIETSDYIGANIRTVYGTENIQLSAQGKSSGFYMNLKKTPEELAGWLEDTYKYITGSAKK